MHGVLHAVDPRARAPHGSNSSAPCRHHTAASHRHFLAITCFVLSPSADSPCTGTLVAFFLVPACSARTPLRTNLSTTPSATDLRYQEQSFLFGHPDAHAYHDAVLRSASIVGVLLLIVAITCLLALRKTNTATPRHLTWLLAALTTVIALLQFPPSLFLWDHLPRLAFLQFPWRLFALLAVITCFAIALAIRQATTRTLLAITTVLVLALTSASIHAYRQPCEDTDPPAARLALFNQHHGEEPTDEYTPLTADNDVLRPDDPPYWLATSAAAPAPGTTETPHELNPDADFGTIPVPPNAHLAATPLHIAINLPVAEFLILNLRDYPNWNITRGNSTLSPAHRDDGLIALALPAGPSTIDITWQRSADQNIGLAITLLAILFTAFLAHRERTPALAPIT